MVTVAVEKWVKNTDDGKKLRNANENYSIIEIFAFSFEDDLYVAVRPDTSSNKWPKNLKSSPRI